MKLKTIDVFKAGRWDEFVATHPQGTAFHLSSWARVLQKTYRYIPYYVVLEDSGKRIRAGCPFFLIRSWLTGSRLVCLPFTDVCYPLVTSGEDIKLLLSSTIERARKGEASYIEIRGQEANTCLRDLHFKNHRYYKGFRLDLSRGTESFWKGLHKSTRRNIRIAEKMELRIEKGETEKDMRDFYFLNLATRRKHGVPSQPYDFFENIWRELILTRVAFMRLVKYKDISIAGGVFLTHRDTIYFKFNASNQSYLRYRTNDFLYWHIIQYGCESGYKFLDGGRTAPDNAGLITFKRNWGLQEKDLHYYYWPTVKGVTATKQGSLKYKIITSLLQQVPTNMSRVIGKLVCKHMG